MKRKSYQKKNINSSISLSNNPTQTVLLGKQFAKKLKKGDVVYLTGQLGTGKTTFVKGIAKQLKIKRPISSSSFILVKEYPERNFYHIDLYRINKQQFLSAGFHHYITANNICVIEWAEKIKPLWSGLTKKFYHIHFQHIDKTKRKIIFHSCELIN